MYPRILIAPSGAFRVYQIADMLISQPDCFVHSSRSTYFGAGRE